jgi:hypothetical protein
LRALEQHLRELPSIPSLNLYSVPAVFPRAIGPNFSVPLRSIATSSVIKSILQNLAAFESVQTFHSAQSRQEKEEYSSTEPPDGPDMPPPVPRPLSGHGYGTRYERMDGTSPTVDWQEPVVFQPSTFKPPIIKRPTTTTRASNPSF